MTSLLKEWYAVIPARAGSKSIKNKNLLPYKGKPLVQYSIELALNIQQISKVLVTTDSEEILAIANELGVVGVRRPESACRDESRDSEYLYHLADFMPDLKLNKPDALLLLRPTCPERDIANLLDAMSFFENSSFDSVRSVVPSSETPYKMWFMEGERGGAISPVLSHPNIIESFNAPRQSLPCSYWQDGYVECIDYALIERKSYPGRLGGWLNKKKTFDIDYLSDIPETVPNVEESLFEHDALDQRFYPS